MDGQVGKIIIFRTLMAKKLANGRSRPVFGPLSGMKKLSESAKAIFFVQWMRFLPRSLGKVHIWQLLRPMDGQLAKYERQVLKSFLARWQN